MTTVIRNELRRLLPIALVLLGGAVLFGGIDLLLNARRQDFLGISYYFCIIVSLLVSFGAGYYARTGSNLESRFLGLWPVSRLRVVLMKSLLNLAFGALTVVFSFIVCGGILSLGGHDAHGVLFREILYEPHFLPLGVALLALVFALALLWCQLLDTVLAVPLVLATGGGLLSGLFWLAVTYLPTYHGPQLSPAVGEFLTQRLPSVAVWITTILSLLLLISALVSAARAPLLETRRRARLSLASFSVLLMVTLAAVLPVAFPLGPVRPGALAELLSVSGGEAFSADLMMDSPGKHVLLQTYPPDAGLWVIDIGTGRQRLLSRSRGDFVTVTAVGAKVAFNSYGQGWLADLDSGHLRRLRVSSSPVILSPTGRYWFRYGQDGHAIITDGKNAIPLGIGTQVVGWTTDESAVYVLTDRDPRTIRQVSLPDGGERVIARDLPDISFATGVSPTGRWIAGWVRTRVQPGTPGTPSFALINAATGTYRMFPGHPTIWSADDRYLWTRGWGRYRPGSLRVLDTQVMRFTVTIGPEHLRGDGAVWPHADPQRQRVYFRAHPKGHPGDAYWSADVSGANLRKVGDIHAALWGVSADGWLVMRDDTSVFLINPQTLERRVLLQASGTLARDGKPPLK